MDRFRFVWRVCIVGIAAFALVQIGLGIHSWWVRGARPPDAEGRAGAFQEPSPLGGSSFHFRDPVRKLRGLSLVAVNDLVPRSSEPFANRSYWLVESLDSSTECLLDLVRVVSIRGGSLALGELRRPRSRMRDYARSRDMRMRLRLVHNASDVSGVESCQEWSPYSRERSVQ
jgi:hypothetical protein